MTCARRLAFLALAIGVALDVGHARRAAAQGAPSVPHPVSRFSAMHPEWPVTMLRARTPVSRTLRGPEVHRYAVPLVRGQFAAIRLDQVDQDLLLVLFDPRGRLLRIVDRNTVHEREVVTVVATMTGTYAVQVAQFDWMVPEARYAIELARREAPGRDAAARADQLLASWYDDTHPGVAVAVLRGGRVIFERTRGLANMEDRVPIGAHTRFDLASISKQFTGTAIALLAEQGALRLDQSVRTILPELPPFMQPVTLDHLLHHTSGVRDWDETLGLAGRRIEDGITTPEVLRLLARQRALNFAPGAEQAYSNGGYVLLAEVVARVTGVPFAPWMRQHLFDPLGMRETLVSDDPHAVIPHVAHSYEGRAPQVTLVSAQPTAIMGSSSVHASLADLVRWAQARRAGSLGGAALQQRLSTPGRLANGTATEYAYGEWIRTRDGRRERSHLGLAAGYRTSMRRFVDADLTVIVLSNDGDDATYSRAEALERVFLGVDEPPADEAPGDDAVPESAQPRVAITAGDFVGRYASDELLTDYEIVAADEGLVARHALLGDVTLVATAPDAFRSAAPFMREVRFRRDGAGQVVAFEVRGGAVRSIEFARRRE
jgi:CubicO group peptidase (beta-lactamase class C family)